VDAMLAGFLMIPFRMLIRDWHRKMIAKLLNRFVDRRSVGELRKDHEAYISEGAITDHRSINGGEHPINPIPNLVATSRIRKIRLTSSSQIAS
jgi:hypothetical protein